MSPAAKGKSRTTNQPTKLAVAGFDNRSRHGRRRRDLIRTYIAALGGESKIAPATLNDITRAVDLVVLAEMKRADALRGVAVDMGDLVRLEGAADRAVRRLGIKASKGKQASPLAQLLAAGR